MFFPPRSETFALAMPPMWVPLSVPWRSHPPGTGPPPPAPGLRTPPAQGEVLPGGQAPAVRHRQQRTLAAVALMVPVRYGLIFRPAALVADGVGLDARPLLAGDLSSRRRWPWPQVSLYPCVDGFGLGAAVVLVDTGQPAARSGFMLPGTAAVKDTDFVPTRVLPL